MSKDHVFVRRLKIYEMSPSNDDDVAAAYIRNAVMQASLKKIGW